VEELHALTVTKGQPEMDGMSLPPATTRTFPLSAPAASLDTVTPRRRRRDSRVPPPLLRAALADHHFLLCLERSPLRDLWVVRDRDDRLRAAQLLRGGDDDRWLDRLLSVTDPALPRLQLVRSDAGQAVLITDLWKRSLLERYYECRTQGLPGVPRPELLGHVRQAAIALDNLHRHYQLHHLNLHPRNILLQPGAVQLEGFGLAELLWLPARVPPAQLNADYAARELARGQFSAQSDQYSLALIYAEMLTGVHPVRGSERRRSRVARDCGALQVRDLPPGDRGIVTRALDPVPQRRFAHASAFAAALADAGGGPEAALRPALIVIPERVVTPAIATAAPALTEPLPQRLWVYAGGGLVVQQDDALRYRLNGAGGLEHRCVAQLYTGSTEPRLEAFRQGWRGRVLFQSAGEYRVALPLTRAGWRRWFERRVGLEVHLHLIPVRAGDPMRNVVVSLTPFGCGPAAAARLLAEWGPRVLTDLRAHLQVRSEQRGQERLRWHQPLRVHQVGYGQRLSAAIDAVAKDISPRGVGLYVPRQLPGDDMYLQWPAQPDVAQLAALARLVRERACGDGWFELGVVFA
jgi:hypothetical protein